MTTFVEFVPALTAREREIVEAFHLAMESWHEEDNPKTDWPIDQMRTTPPAKEPEWFEREVRKDANGGMIIRLAWAGIKHGDRVRITKMEAK